MSIYDISTYFHQHVPLTATAQLVKCHVAAPRLCRDVLPPTSPRA